MEIQLLETKMGTSFIVQFSFDCKIKLQLTQGKIFQVQSRAVGK